MTFDVLFDDLTEMETKDGGTVRVIRARYPYLMCWYREYYWAGNEIRYKASGEAVCGIKHLDEFKVADLKKDWEIWEQLSQEQQVELEIRGGVETATSKPGRKPKREEVEEVEEAETEVTV